MTKKALITGITGQDGSWLAELLLQNNYEVWGMDRTSAAPNYWRIEHILDQINLHTANLCDPAALYKMIRQIRPDEIYHLGAQSHVGRSFKLPGETAQITGLGTLNMLDAVLMMGPEYYHHVRFYQASSSEMFGDVRGQVPQTEETPFNPANPYAIAKVFAHNMCRLYRESYGMFISCGILFNHESERRGELFVTRKVAYGAAALALGIRNSARLNENSEPIVKNGKLGLGNLEAVRDWGYAPDYVRGMWLMLKHDEPGDFVLATGVGRTIRDLVQAAFDAAFGERGVNWEQYVDVKENLVRPKETGPLIGDAGRAREILRWRAETSFEEMLDVMVKAEMAQLRAGRP